MASQVGNLWRYPQFGAHAIMYNFQNLSLDLVSLSTEALELAFDKGREISDVEVLIV